MSSHQYESWFLAKINVSCFNSSPMVEVCCRVLMIDYKFSNFLKKNLHYENCQKWKLVIMQCGAVGRNSILGAHQGSKLEKKYNYEIVYLLLR